MTTQSKILVRGAREHNLKNIDVEVPRDALVVVTGLSGSGKSTLAFDTIYAEGQRRYVESLSAYARQFLQVMEKPDVDSIEGLSPAISIEQKTTSRNPRSTVGTVTEIYDYMRVLFARVGIPHSPATGLPIESQSVSQMVDRILAMGEKTRLNLLAPIVRDRKGEYRAELADLRRQGYSRLRVDDVMYDIEEVPPLDKNYKHTIEVVVDRLVVKDNLGNRVADSIETALELADGITIAEDADTGERSIFSAKFACPVSGFTISEIEPRLFSFNSPTGACPTCDGLGTREYFDPILIVPDTSRSLRSGAIAPWSNSRSREYYDQTLAGLAKAFKFSLSTRFRDLDENQQKAILYGSGDKPVKITYRADRRKYSIERPFEGVIPNLERLARESRSRSVLEELKRYQTRSNCKACGGTRLKDEALAVRICGRHIGEIADLSISKCLEWFREVPTGLTNIQNEIAAGILKEITDRLQFLCNVGLEYLTLSRMSRTLSGGEGQRIRLASQIGSGLTGVLYVLDEPSIGLHQRDNSRLLDTLGHLRDLGNTVLVVEHDEEAMRAADWIIDLGPGAGVHGGEVVASGRLGTILRSSESLTARYLRRDEVIEIPAVRRSIDEKKQVRVTGARANNLKNIDVGIPLGVMTCITGVSGGGKSSLVVETLYKALARELNRAREVPGDFDRITGLEYVEKVIEIDQSPIGRTPRSNPATYIGAFSPIREWFSGLPEAKARGYKAGRFSFNVQGGRCEACEGAGLNKIEMHFLADVYVQCDQCNGKRYNRETLEVRYRGKSIADILDMTVEEGVEFFSAITAIRSKLEMLERVGLGYIKIGQQATTLSGGEAQRVKLSKELSRRTTARTLYILDEPTTGLHFDDIRRLLGILQTLVDQGSTVVVIEHNLDVIKTADWIIDLGPEGGDGGGSIVAAGTPEDLTLVTESHTGRYLASHLPIPQRRVASG